MEEENIEEMDKEKCPVVEEEKAEVKDEHNLEDVFVKEVAIGNPLETLSL